LIETNTNDEVGDDYKVKATDNVTIVLKLEKESSEDSEKVKK